MNEKTITAFNAICPECAEIRLHDFVVGTRDKAFASALTRCLVCNKVREWNLIERPRETFLPGIDDRKETA